MNIAANITNANFLATISSPARAEILDSIAVHYGTTAAAIQDEVVGEGAEDLLEYMAEPARSRTRTLMRAYGFR